MNKQTFIAILLFASCKVFAHPDARELSSQDLRRCLAASFAAYENPAKLLDKSPWSSAEPVTCKTFSGHTGGLVGNTHYPEYGIFIAQGRSITIAFPGTNFLKINDVFTDTNVVGHNLQNEDYQDGGFQHHIIGGTGSTGVGYCHDGFYKAYKSCSGDVRQYIRDYATDTGCSLGNLHITLTGHSLGGALAILAGADLVNALYNRKNSENNIRVVTFAAPRVFNSLAAKRYDDLLVLQRNHLRIEVTQDVIPTVPALLVVRAHPVRTTAAAVCNFLRRMCRIPDPIFEDEKIHTKATGQVMHFEKPLGHVAHSLKTYEKTLKNKELI